MKRLLLAILILWTVPACDGVNLDAQDDVIDAEGKADGVTHPLGTYRFADPSGDQGKLGFVLLVVMSDGTYYRQAPATNCTANCPPQEQQGNYRFSSSGSYRYIRFLDQSGTLIDRYNWEMKGSKLTLRKVNTSQHYAFTLAEPFCTWFSFCALQGRSLPGPGGWDCQEYTCKFAPCAFGTYYEGNSFDGAPGVKLTTTKILDAAHPATGILLEQILAMMKTYYSDVTTFTAAVEITDDQNFQYRTAIPHNGKRYTVIWYYGGDNMVGAIFPEASAQQVARIGDQSIYECTVP